MKPLSERLLERAEAYPEDVFGPITDDERKFYASIIQRAAAQMGRHMAPMLREAAALAKSVETAATGEVWQHAYIDGQRSSSIVITREPEDGLAIMGQRVALVPLPQPEES